MGPRKKSLPIAVGHKSEIVPRTLVNVLIAFKVVSGSKWPIYVFPEVRYLSAALLMARVRPVGAHLLAG